MYKIQKSIVSLLVVIAVLLALNLFSMESRTANAETVMAGGEDPYIVKLLPKSAEQVDCIWSDGRKDTYAGDDNTNCIWHVQDIHGQVDHPFPVIDAIHSADGKGIMMTFADGRVDMVGYMAGIENRCTIAGIGTPSLCTADTDRNGVVNTEDLLELFAQWGSCP